MSYHPTGHLYDGAPLVIPSGTPDRELQTGVTADCFATMRDGIRLGADVYLPRAVGPFPAIVIRMPYGKQTPAMGMAVLGAWLARKGYACVVQDVRGKFSSGGDFDPGVHEVEDGYDTVDWVAGQDWCDGAIGLFGESYYGFTAYAAAISGHPAVRAIAPGDIGLDRRRAWFRQGAFLLNTTGYWALSMDAPEYADVAGVDPFCLPLINLPQPLGLEGAFYRNLLAHAEDSTWWQQRSLAHRLVDIRCAVLSWSGWYDNYTGPQLADFERLLEVHPTPEHLHLMIGPWDHEGSAGTATRAACLPIPATAQHRWDTYQAFFDRYLRGDDNGFGRAGAANIFTLGLNQWQTTSTWPPPALKPTPLYLRHGAELSFDPPTTAEAPDRYRYDPADPVVETVGENCWSLATTLRDRRRLDTREDILRYVTPPLHRALEITGPVSARLFAATSAIDTDFTVTLCHVLANGTVNTIQDGIVRARYRRGMDAPAALVPGQVEQYDITLFATSYFIPAGDRLRVDVSSSSFDRYDRNLNTGEPAWLAAAPVLANQTIYHDSQHPSYVLLPVPT